MKSYSARSLECEKHKIIRLAAHQKCVEKAMICSQNCQFNQAHLQNGDHPTIPVEQFVSIIKAKRSQIQKQGQAHISKIEEQFKRAVQNLKIKKKECQQNIKQLIKTAGYGEKHLSGLQKVQNLRYQSLSCKQVHDLLKFQPLMSKKTKDSFQKNVREFQNCKFKNLMNDKNFSKGYQINTTELTNKKNMKQQKYTQKKNQKYQIIRQKPRINPPDYLLVQDKQYFKELLEKNEELQIQLRKAQNALKRINSSKNQQKVNASRQQAHSNSDSDLVVQIKKNQTGSSDKSAFMEAVQKYMDKKGQQNNYINQKKKQVENININKQKDTIIAQKSKVPSLTPLQSVQPQKERQQKKDLKMQQDGKKIQNLSQEAKKLQIQYQNKPKFTVAGIKQKGNDIPEKQIQRHQEKQFKQKIIATAQTSTKDNKKIDLNSKAKEQNIAATDKASTVNSKQIIKEEYNESQQIYNYYNRQSKNTQAKYTNTQVLKNCGNSLETIIKLQHTHPIPSFNTKFALKQIPKLTYDKQKITTFNFSPKVNNNRQSHIEANNISTSNNINFNKEKGAQSQNNTPNKAAIPLRSQVKSQVTSFLNAPTGSFKAPPAMMLNDPIMRNNKVDISKVFEMQEQAKKLKQLKMQQEERLRREIEQKQKKQLEQVRRKKQIQQKKRLQAEKERQKTDEQIIQNLMKSNEVLQSEMTPNFQFLQNQIPKLAYQNQITSMKSKPGVQTFGQQMKMQEQKQQGQMELQQCSDSFVI